MENDLMMAELVCAVAERCFGGRLPDAPEWVAVAVVAAIPELAEVDDAFLEDLARAARRHIDAQNARLVQ